MFCEHDWKEIGRSYNPPKKLQGVTKEERRMERLFLGTTTILWGCRSCDNTREEEVLAPPLEKENENT